MPNDRQPPIMTAAHVEAMRWVVSEWPYANVRFDRRLLCDIHAHLASLEDAPVPSQDIDETPTNLQAWTYSPDEITSDAHRFIPHREPLSPDWRREFAPLDMTSYESDQ